MRRGVAVAITLVLSISMILSVFLFKVTQSVTPILEPTLVTTTETDFTTVDNTSGSTNEQILLESYNWETATSLILFLRNVGPTPVNFADWFINGIPASSVAGCSSTLPVGENCVATLTVGEGAYSTGESYIIKIVSLDGAVFSFSAIDGSAS